MTAERQAWGPGVADPHAIRRPSQVDVVEMYGETGAGYPCIVYQVPDEDPVFVVIGDHDIAIALGELLADTARQLREQ